MANPKEQWKTIMEIANVFYDQPLTNNVAVELLIRLKEFDEDRLETRRDLVFSQAWVFQSKSIAKGGDLC